MCDASVYKELEAQFRNQASSPCPKSAWLCDDYLGTNFLFLEDRAAGKQKIAAMLCRQMIYLEYMMSNLPVEADDFWPAGGVRDFGATVMQNADESIWKIDKTKMLPASDPKATAKKRLAIQLFVLGKLIKPDITPSQLESDYLVYVKSVSDIVDYYINNINDIAATAPISKDRWFQNQSNPLVPLPPPSWLLFPFGNQVPLRITPLVTDEIKGKPSMALGDYYFSNMYPEFYNPARYYYAYNSRVDIPDFIRYKAIGDFPWDVFGWNPANKGQLQDFGMNDKLYEYLKYLGNPSASFEPFRTIEIEMGESGNPVPQRCLLPDAKCNVWEYEGFLTFQDWANWVDGQQRITLSDADLALIRTIDFDADFETFFKTAYVDYSVNPEFMPNYSQIIQWRFSNYCKDRLDFMPIESVGYDCNEDVYNFIVGSLVKIRFEKYITELTDVNTVIKHTGVHDVQLLFGYDVFSKSEITLTYSQIMENIERLTNLILVYEFKQYRNEDDLAHITKFKEITKKYFLIPESFINSENHIMIIDIGSITVYVKAVYQVYKNALTHISNFNSAINLSTNTTLLEECMLNTPTFEGVKMTPEQVTKYKAMVAKIFTNDWQKLAVDEYNTAVGAVEQAYQNETWIAQHPIANWFKVNVLQGLITPIMDLAVSGSPIFDGFITAMYSAFVSTNPIGLALLALSLTLVNTTWETQAPPGSVFHHEPPLSSDEIGKQYGIQIAVWAGTETVGFLLAKYHVKIATLSAQGVGFVSAKVSRFMGTLFEDLEPVVERIRQNEVKLAGAIGQDAERGVLQKLNNLKKFEDELAALAAKTKYYDKLKALGAQKDELFAKLEQSLLGEEAFEGEAAALNKKYDDIMEAFKNEYKEIEELNDGLITAIKDIRDNIKNIGREAKDIGGAIVNALEDAEEAYKEIAKAKDLATKAKLAYADALAIPTSTPAEKQAALLAKMAAENEYMDVLEEFNRKAFIAKLLASSVSSLPTLLNIVTMEVHYNHLLAAIMVGIQSPISSQITKLVTDGIYSSFGEKEVGQSYGIMVNLIISWFKDNQIIAMTDNLVTCDDFPFIDPKTNIPELEVEMIRLKRIYFEPYAIAYSVAESLKADSKGDEFEKKAVKAATEAYCGFNDQIEQINCIAEQTKIVKEQYNAAIKLAEEQRDAALKAYVDYYKYIFNKYSKSPITAEYLDKLPDGCTKITSLTREERAIEIAKNNKRRQEALDRYKPK